MATLRGRTLFFITSPRSPMKMAPEIEILVKYFINDPWNSSTQEHYMKRLVVSEAFEGYGSKGDLAFSARDRINRGPKALGFVDISPTIQLTEPGKNFLDAEIAGEILLRQLLKFQLPSPYHTISKKSDVSFSVKPYLEIFRLIYTLKEVSFDEIQIFGMQLTNYNKFDNIVLAIKEFRREKELHVGNYKTFVGQYLYKELKKIYNREIQEGKTKTRESTDVSIDNFLRTKASNLHDYTDACFRYLRATGIVSLSQSGKSLSISQEKEEEVKYFLTNIPRNPVYVNDEKTYKQYLFNPELPVLYTDDRNNLEKEGNRLGLKNVKIIPTFELKKILRNHVVKRKYALINKQICELKAYSSYSDVMETFNCIKEKRYYDIPLMLEWNIWRAMTMLDGGKIKANLKFDDNGDPMSTASGNISDIICDYGDFMLSVEVTMQTGQRQYEMEGEPVSRHLASIKKEQGKETFCFFIAPKINDACVAHFYILYKEKISFYGGTSAIIPIELEVFKKMVEQAKNAHIVPLPSHIKSLCDYSVMAAQSSKNEVEWYKSVRNRSLCWLTV